MIQRIQSVYLLLTSLIQLLFLSGNILKFSDRSGSEYELVITGLHRLSADGKYIPVENQIILPVIVAVIFIISFSSVFLYKKRKIQAGFARAVIVAATVLAAYLAYLAISVSTRYELTFQPVLALIYPFLTILLSYFALKGIRKDEELVRSYDRLR